MGKVVDDAFQSLKAYLIHLPKIASLVLGQTLLLYLVILEQAVSTTLVVETTKEQIPVYCLLIKKFAYTLVLASQKLRPYLRHTMWLSSSTNC